MVNKATNKNLCSRCGAEIKEGYEYGTDEEPLCDECYFDNTEICPICEAHFELDDKEEYFFITKESSELTHKPVGMYHVKEHPFFYGDCVTGFDSFIANAIEKVNDLDIEAYLAEKYPKSDNHVSVDFICPDCARKYKTINVKK